MKMTAERLEALRTREEFLEQLQAFGDMKGVLRLRIALASRQQYSAQDDSGGMREGLRRLREPGRFAHRLPLLRMTLLAVICAGWWLGTLIGVAQTSIAVKSPTPLEQSLMANEKRLIEAKKKDDGAFFKRAVSAGFALVGVDGNLLQGQEAIDGLGDSDLAELTPYDMKVVLAGEDTAVVTYDAIVREKPQEDQGPPPRYQHFSSVWVKQDNEWKLSFQQATATHWGDW
jgi:hypothetical protein